MMQKKLNYELIIKSRMNKLKLGTVRDAIMEFNYRYMRKNKMRELVLPQWF